MKSTFLTLILVFLIGSLWSQNTYEEAIDKGDTALSRGQFKSALDYYRAAEAFKPEKEKEVALKISRLFAEIEQLDTKLRTQQILVEKAARRVDSITLANQATFDSLLVLRGQLDSININAQSKRIKSELSFLNNRMELFIRSEQFEEAKRALASSYELVQADPLLTDEGLAKFESDILRKNTERIDDLILVADSLKIAQEKRVRTFYQTLIKADSLRDIDIISSYRFYKEAEQFRVDNDLLKSKIDTLNIFSKNLPENERTYLNANFYHIDNNVRYRDLYLAALLYKKFYFSPPDTIQKDQSNITFIPEVKKRFKDLRKNRRRNLIYIDLFGVAHGFEKVDFYRDNAIYSGASVEKERQEKFRAVFGVAYEYRFHPRWSVDARFTVQGSNQDSFRINVDTDIAPFVYRPVVKNNSSYLSFHLGYHHKNSSMLKERYGHFYLKGGVGIRFTNVKYQINGTSLRELPNQGDTTLVVALEQSMVSQRYKKLEPYFEFVAGITNIFPFKVAPKQKSSVFLEMGGHYAPEFGKDRSAYSRELFNELEAYKQVTLSEAERIYQRLEEVPVPEPYANTSYGGNFGFHIKDIILFLRLGINFAF